MVQNMPGNVGDTGDAGLIPDTLEREKATHSSILAWKIPWTERGAWRATVHGVTGVRHDLATKPPAVLSAILF